MTYLCTYGKWDVVDVWIRSEVDAQYESTEPLWKSQRSVTGTCLPKGTNLRVYRGNKDPGSHKRRQQSMGRIFVLYDSWCSFRPCPVLDFLKPSPFSEIPPTPWINSEVSTHPTQCISSLLSCEVRLLSPVRLCRYPFTYDSKTLSLRTDRNVLTIIPIHQPGLVAPVTYDLIPQTWLKTSVVPQWLPKSSRPSTTL